MEGVIQKTIVDGKIDGWDSGRSHGNRAML